MLKNGLKESSRVLEIGCGSRNITAWIAKQIGDEGTVLAIDNIQEQLNLLLKLCRKMGSQM